ncbi:hypothetical protein AVEN_39440-1 [Araneus ventricosus]|uniref:Uncharacterized protein n=1 Tax=Araneus ventricosus TaxID=182803 RepID=A0A4Y2SR72_ARAVE|nr:hypothetical protein AVEN_39440-1 [Araneus ventricosus]
MHIILTQKSPTSYVIANPDNPNEPVGTYHASALKVYKQDESATPVHPLRKSGRPRKTYTSGSSPRRSGKRRNPEGESVTITFCLVLLPAARTFRNQKQDRESDLTVRAGTMFSPLTGTDKSRHA